MKAILYIGHGTRSKKGVKEANAFCQRVMRRIDVPIQEVSFLEIAEPSIEVGFKRCVIRGATDITVVPLFLLAAGHIKQDIPRTLDFLQERYPHIQIDVKDPLGVQGKILDGVAELVKVTAGYLGPHDQLLIVGRGSSDPEIHINFSEIAKGIKVRLGIKHVSVCYLAAAEPRLVEGLEKITKRAEGRVIVVPYLLFSGLLIAGVNQVVLERQKQGLPILQTGPLSNHQVIENIVVDRATSKEGIEL